MQGNFLSLLLHKPKGITSFEAVRKVQNIVQEILYGNKKVRQKDKIKAGHTGTLDKEASGLLIILLDRATRLSNYFLKLDKQYNATFLLGKQTDTLDSAGKIIATSKIPTQSNFEKAFNKFKGTLDQRPPEYSAIHVEGERAYQRIRNNEVVNMPLRKITVYNSQIHSFEPPHVHCSFSVSSGTYIRALVRDIAFQCNTVAYMSALERSSIDTITLNEANTFESIKELLLQNITPKVDILQKICQPADVLLQKIIQPHIIYVETLDDRNALSYGKMPSCVNNIDYEKINNKFVFLYDKKGFLSFYEWAETKWKLVVHTQ